MMMLALSLLLALIPLLGIAWILRYGSITTVDGLFTSLILLAMSGILGINVLLELKKRTPSGRRQSVAQAKATSSGMVQRGKVEKVEFYEANVGLPNKSIVMLSNGAKSSQMLVFEGDMRNALPTGRNVEITFRKESGHNELIWQAYVGFVELDFLNFPALYHSGRSRLSLCHTLPSAAGRALLQFKQHINSQNS